MQARYAASLGLVLGGLALAWQAHEPARLVEKAKSSLVGARWLDRLTKLHVPASAQEPTKFSRNGETWLEVVALDAKSVAGVERGDELVHAGAIGGATLRRKALRDGVEDFVDYAVAPPERRLRYELHLGAAVAGLRLVENVLELLDARGAPRFTVRRPSLIDAHGVTSIPRYALSGCEADRDPRPPQGRPVTPPGASTCRFDVDFSESDVAFPAVLDPAWTESSAPNIVPEGGFLFGLPGGNVLHIAPGAKRAEVWDRNTGTFAITGGPVEQRSIFTPVALAGGSVALVGGSQFVTNILFASVEKYDVDTGQFVIVGSLKTARRFAAVSQLQDGRLFVGGGCMQLTSGSCSKYTASTELFDLTTGQAVDGVPLPWTPRAKSSAVTLQDGRVLIAGGSDPAASLSEAYLYSTATGMAATGSLVMPRVASAALLRSDNTVFLFGGIADGIPGTYQKVEPVEVFDPAADAGKGAFSLGPTPQVVVRGATVLGDSLLVVGDEPWADDSQGRAMLLAPEATSWVDAHPPALDVIRGVTAISPTAALAISLVPPPRSFVLELQQSGGSCDADGQCASGSCNGGFCCSQACEGACTTCTATGACAAVVAGEDPDTCVAPQECGLTGRCGLRVTMPCSVDLDCAGEHCVDGYCCNGACSGSCETCAGLAPGICLPVVGDAAPGREACQSEGQCGGSCDGIGPDCVYPGADEVCENVCEGDLHLLRTCDGAGACTEDEPQECAGHFACADDECLSSCQADEDCAPGRICADGECLADLGAACNEAAQCANQNCVDGVCCDGLCEGQCEACNVVGQEGTCAASTGAPRGERPACDGSGLCAGECDGVDSEACSYPGSETLCSSACQGTLLEQGTCGGDGQCLADEARACSGDFVCEGFACLDSCGRDAECRDGFRCETSSKRCVPNGQRCEGDVSVSAEGARQDCTPYRCQGGYCPGSCSASDDCSDGFVCGDEQVCIPIPQAKAESDGCSVGSRPRRGGTESLLVLLILGALARGRRRRA